MVWGNWGLPFCDFWIRNTWTYPCWHRVLCSWIFWDRCCRGTRKIFYRWDDWATRFPRGHWSSSFSLEEGENKMSVCLHSIVMDAMCMMDGWKMKMGNLVLTFRRRFLRTTRTPLTDICMVTLRFFRFCTLHSYCEKRREDKAINIT